MLVQHQLVVLLLMVTNAQLDGHSKGLDKIDLLKRKHTLIKFEQQLISSLSVPPAINVNESPRHKWMQLPDFIRKRLMASNRVLEHSEMETKEIFIPVKIVESCTIMNLSMPHVCVRFSLDHSTINRQITSTILYLDLVRGLDESNAYVIQQDQVASNDTLTLEKQKGNLLRVNINRWIYNYTGNGGSNSHQFVIACLNGCKPRVFNEAQLFIEVVLGSELLSRKKRSVDESTRTCTNNEILCCKRSFVFRPVDIGWNWIVDPEEIRLNYCMGECNDQTSNYTYSKVLSLLKKSKNANLTPQQLTAMTFCCAPKKYSGLNVIYLTNTNNSFQKIHLNNMIVDSCACV